jgi:hypothetical protein
VTHGEPQVLSFAEVADSSRLEARPEEDVNWEKPRNLGRLVRHSFARAAWNRPHAASA